MSMITGVSENSYTVLVYILYCCGIHFILLWYIKYTFKKVLLSKKCYICGIKMQ